MGDARRRRAACGFAWVTGLASSFLLVGVPARKIGYLSSQRLLDVVTKHDAARFVPLVVFVAVWALVASMLVHMLIDVIQRWDRRRRLEAAGTACESRRFLEP